MAFLASHHIHLKYASSFYDITPMDWYYKGRLEYHFWGILEAG
jgi:hypothetical protein